MDEILLKAYADGIVNSLKERNGGNSFATVDVREEIYDEDSAGTALLRFLVKFYWDSTGPFGADYTNSVEAVLTLNISDSRVTIGERMNWDHLTIEACGSAADWLAQQAVAHRI